LVVRRRDIEDRGTRAPAQGRHSARSQAGAAPPSRAAYALALIVFGVGLATGIFSGERICS
jgi:hypothetical protein